MSQMPPRPRKPPPSAPTLRPREALALLDNLLRRGKEIEQDSSLQHDAFSLWHSEVSNVLARALGPESPEVESFAAHASYGGPLLFYTPQHELQQARCRAMVNALVALQGCMRIIRAHEPQEEQGHRESHVPTVFLVHGHDIATLREVQACLNSEFRGKLKVVVLMDEPNRGSEQLFLKLYRHASESDAAVVVYTADDEANSKADPVRREARPRPNVHIELGFFLGRVGPERTFILRDVSATLPSDVLGGMVIPLDGQWKHELTRDLRHWLDSR